MNIIAKEKKYIMQTYKRHALVPVRAKGQFLWDEKGKKYLDFFSGISVCNTGHCHPRVVAAIKKQAQRLIHVSNHYYVEPQARLAEMLVRASFPGQVFLSNSGAEANECAIKLARKWGKGKRYEIITFNNSFHGRTLATLTATGQMKFHKGFEPMLPGFRYAEFNDLASVKKLISKKTAAILVEPIQGEGGVILASSAFLKGLRTLCDKHGILLIFDEIQTGLGRTGTLFAWQNYGVRPDIMTLAKSLAGGLPLGATVASPEVAGAFSYGDHGTTFGGNPVSCAASCAVMGLLSPVLMRSVNKLGGIFITGLEQLKKKYPCIKDVRGIGLMVGMELDRPGADIVQFCQDKGLIINCTQGNILRFLPPLVITGRDVATTLRILEEALKWETLKK